MLRLVGYSEYRDALARLDALVTLATEEELRVIDEIIRSRDEYTVYTNLSRRLEQQSLSSLSDPAAGGPQRGLGWILALARVELAAMAAVYTDADDPFALLPPSRLEWPQYQELLLDSARMHYLALGNDPAAHRYAEYRNAQVTMEHVENGRPEIDYAHALAYGRRVLLAQSFLAAVEKHLGVQLSDVQRADLETWESHVQDLQSTLLDKVFCLDRVERDIETETTSEFDSLRGARACYLSFAGGELKAGRAKLGPENTRTTQEVHEHHRTLGPDNPTPTLDP